MTILQEQKAAKKERAKEKQAGDESQSSPLPDTEPFLLIIIFNLTLHVITMQGAMQAAPRLTHKF